MRHAVANYICNTELELNHGGFKPAIAPFVGELVGVELMTKLGIGAPTEVRAATGDGVVRAINQ